MAEQDRPAARATGAWRVLTALVLAAALVGVAWFHVDLWERWSRQRSIEAAGTVEVGTVADLRTTSAPDGSARHEVEVAVDGGGQVTEVVDGRTHGRLEVGDPVRLGVDPDTGEGVVVSDEDPGRTVAVVTAVEVVLLLVVLGLMVRERRRTTGR